MYFVILVQNSKW